MEGYIFPRQHPEVLHEVLEVLPRYIGRHPMVGARHRSAVLEHAFRTGQLLVDGTPNWIEELVKAA